MAWLVVALAASVPGTARVAPLMVAAACRHHLPQVRDAAESRAAPWLGAAVVPASGAVALEDWFHGASGLCAGDRALIVAAAEVLPASPPPDFGPVDGNPMSMADLGLSDDLETRSTRPPPPPRPDRVNLAVWEGPAPASDTEAVTTYRALVAAAGGDDERTPATDAIGAYVAALEAHWPDPPTDDTALRPWIGGPLVELASGPMLPLAFVGGDVLDAAAFAAELAEARHLVCFDAAQGLLLTSVARTRVGTTPFVPADGPRPWWRRR